MAMLKLNKYKKIFASEIFNQKNEIKLVTEKGSAKSR